MTESRMLFANFNQDFSCISVGSKKGYNITNCDPFGRVYSQNDGPRAIVEMLFCTSLIALVGGGEEGTSQRKLQIVNTKRQSLICELLFPSTILAVKLNRKALVIVLETEIYVYDISNMRLIHVVETVSNPEGICALSPSSENSYLAYPSPLPEQQTGTASAPTPSTSTPAGAILLLSTKSSTVTVVNLIHAHRSPLGLLSMNPDGTMVASASVKGTIIRVHAVPSGQKLYQFRRGSREATIYSMSFNSVSSLLAVSSSSGSVHVFRLGSSSKSSSSSTTSTSNNTTTSPTSTNNNTSSTPSDTNSIEGSTEDDATPGSTGTTRASSLRRRSMQMVGKSLTGYLPSAVTEMWEPQRDFAWFKLPGGSNHTRCIVGMSGTMPQIMAISSDGYFYAYTIDLENGGECVLMKQYSLLDAGEEGNA